MPSLTRASRACSVATRYLRETGLGVGTSAGLVVGKRWALLAALPVLAFGVSCSSSAEPSRVTGALEAASDELAGFTPEVPVEGQPVIQSSLQCSSLGEEPVVYLAFRTAEPDALAQEMAGYLEDRGWVSTDDLRSSGEGELLFEEVDGRSVATLEKSFGEDVALVAIVQPDSAAGSGVHIAARESAC